MQMKTIKRKTPTSLSKQSQAIHYEYNYDGNKTKIMECQHLFRLELRERW